MKLSFGVFAFLGSAVYSQEFSCTTDYRSDTYRHWNWGFEESVCKLQCVERPWNSDDSDETIVNSYVAEDLSFEQLLMACSNLKTAASVYGDECNELDDLVWSDYCSCPACQCSDEGATKFKSSESLLTKKCDSCTCNYQWEFNKTVTTCVYEGIYGYYSDEVPLSGLLECPPQGSCDVDGEKKYPGQSWWEDSAGCDTWCYCSDNYEKKCTKGIEELKKLDGWKLDRVFYDTWNYQLCSPKTDNSNLLRMEASTFDEQQGTCDRSDRSFYCACPSDLGDGFFEAEDRNNLRSLSSPAQSKECLACSCQEGKLECDGIDYYPVEAQATYACPPPQVDLKCHTGEMPLGETTLPPLESAPSRSNLPSHYCSWSVDEDDESSPWAGSEQTVYYSYENGGLCGFFNAEDNSCIKMVQSHVWDDCNGEDNVVYEYTSTYYTACCKTDNCNHEIPDLSKCKEDDRLKAFFDELQPCIASVNSDYNFLFGECGTRDSFITCDDVKQNMLGQFACFCKAYSSIYNIATNDEWKRWLMDMISTSVEDLQELNSILGCGFEPKCNLETGCSTGSTDPECGEDGNKAVPVANTCSPPCSDGQTCDSTGACKTTVVYDESNPCLNHQDCIDREDEQYKCHTDGGFCYFNECNDADDCDAGQRCFKSLKFHGSGAEAKRYRPGECKFYTEVTGQATLAKISAPLMLMVTMVPLLRYAF